MGRTKKDRMFWESAVLNNSTYQQYYSRLTELATVMFKWEGLPDTIDERFLEMTLFANGMAVFFKDDALGYLALPVAIGGKLNVYNIPTNRRAYASNGYQKTMDETDSVIIFNNYLHTNSKLDIEMFSRRLYNIERAIDVNVNAQKTPILIECSEQQRLTLKNLYMQYDGNQPVIFADNALSSEALKVLKTDAPFVADKLRTEKTATWNEALTYLGISNTNFTKKERLVSDEVMRSQGGTIASRYSRLEMRRQACEQINRMFPELNVTCDYREDFRELDDEYMITGETGGNEIVETVKDIRTRGGKVQTGKAGVTVE